MAWRRLDRVQSEAEFIASRKAEQRVEEQLEKVLVRAERMIEKEIDADAKEVERELKEAKDESAAT